MGNPFACLARRSWWVLPVLCLAAAAGFPAPSLAEEAPANSGTPGKVLKTLEAVHSSIERSILGDVIWFDEFFGNPITEESRETKYVLRWRNALRWEEGAGFRFRTSVRANVRLPGIGERFHLLVTGENEAEPPTGIPEDPGTPGFDQTLQNTQVVNTELRYVVLQTPSNTLFLGAGVRIKLPLDVFVRTRFQHTHPLGSASLIRFWETLFWKHSEGFGETTEIDFERRLGPKLLLRWANSGTLSEKKRGLQWGTGLSLPWAISPRNVLTPGGSISGTTLPSAVVEKYRVSLLFRRDLHQHWLYLELEPEISWPRNAAGSYVPVYASTVRLELLFQKSDREKEGQRSGPPAP